IDAQKMAGLVRGGLLPQASGDPAALRATRALLRRLTYGRHRASPCVACAPRGQPVGRRDRPRIGAVCPLVRLVSGVGDHRIADRPRPAPGWETARISVTPAPTAGLRLFPTSDGSEDTPPRLFPSPAPPR